MRKRARKLAETVRILADAAASARQAARELNSFGHELKKIWYLQELRLRLYARARANAKEARGDEAAKHVGHDIRSDESSLSDRVLDPEHSDRNGGD
jgi:hypothetical protein